jgi:hypothetical protein
MVPWRPRLLAILALAVAGGPVAISCTVCTVCEPAQGVCDLPAAGLPGSLSAANGCDDLAFPHPTRLNVTGVVTATKGLDGGGGALTVAGDGPGARVDFFLAARDIATAGVAWRDLEVTLAGTGAFVSSDERWHNATLRTMDPANNGGLSATVERAAFTATHGRGPGDGNVTAITFADVWHAAVTDTRFDDCGCTGARLSIAASGFGGVVLRNTTYADAGTTPAGCNATTAFVLGPVDTTAEYFTVVDSVVEGACEPAVALALDRVLPPVILGSTPPGWTILTHDALTYLRELARLNTLWGALHDVAAYDPYPTHLVETCEDFCTEFPWNTIRDPQPTASATYTPMFELEAVDQGESLLLTGGVCLSIPWTANVNAGFTAAAWVRHPSPPATGAPPQTVVEWNNGQFALRVTGAAAVFCHAGTTTAGVVLAAVAPGEWFYAACSHDPGAAELRLVLHRSTAAPGGGGFGLGPAFASATVANPLPLMSTPVSMAAGCGAADHLLIDELRVWGAPRAVAAMAADAGVVPSGYEPGLARYYRFDRLGTEATPQTVHDWSRGSRYDPGIDATLYVPAAVTGPVFERSDLGLHLGLFRFHFWTQTTAADTAFTVDFGEYADVRHHGSCATRYAVDETTAWDDLWLNGGFPNPRIPTGTWLTLLNGTTAAAYPHIPPGDLVEVHVFRDFTLPELEACVTRFGAPAITSINVPDGSLVYSGRLFHTNTRAYNTEAEVEGERVVNGVAFNFQITVRPTADGTVVAIQTNLFHFAMEVVAVWFPGVDSDLYVTVCTFVRHIEQAYQDLITRTTFLHDARVRDRGETGPEMEFINTAAPCLAANHTAVLRESRADAAHDDWLGNFPAPAAWHAHMGMPAGTGGGGPTVPWHVNGTAPGCVPPPVGQYGALPIDADVTVRFPRDFPYTHVDVEAVLVFEIPTYPGPPPPVPTVHPVLKLSVDGMGTLGLFSLDVGANGTAAAPLGGSPPPFGWPGYAAVDVPGYCTAGAGAVALRTAVVPLAVLGHPINHAEYQDTPLHLRWRLVPSPDPAYAGLRWGLAALRIRSHTHPDSYCVQKWDLRTHGEYLTTDFRGVHPLEFDVYVYDQHALEFLLRTNNHPLTAVLALDVRRGQLGPAPPPPPPPPADHVAGGSAIIRNLAIIAAVLLALCLFVPVCCVINCYRSRVAVYVVVYAPADVPNCYPRADGK